MKTYIISFAIALLFLSGSVIAQDFSWIDAEETGYDLNPNMVRYGVAASPDGTTWFAGMKEKVTSYTNMMGDLFLIRYDADGNRMEEYLIEGAAYVTAMETDNEGNLYIAGDFYSEDLVFWEGTTLSWEDLSVNGFLARIMPGGNLIWAKKIKDLAGSYSSVGALKHDNGTLYMAHAAWPGSWVSEVDENGNFTAFIEQEDVGIASDVDTDAQGNIYVTGSCAGSQALFNGVSYPNPFSYSKHLVKYNAEGIPQWIHFSEDVTCIFPKVEVGPDDHIYWSGALNNPCLFDTIPLNGPDWVFDFYLARFDPEGNVQWAREVPEGLSGDAGPGLLDHLKVLPDNSVAFAGFLRGTIDWGNGIISSSPIPGNNLMMVNFSSDGSALWAKNSTGDNFKVAQAIDADPDGNLFFTAVAHDTVTLGNLEIYRESYYYPLIVKLETNLTTGLTRNTEKVGTLFIRPNPVRESIHLPFESTRILHARLFSMTGDQVLDLAQTAVIDIRHLKEGLYFIMVELSDGPIRSGKVIISH